MTRYHNQNQDNKRRGKQQGPGSAANESTLKYIVKCLLAGKVDYAASYLDNVSKESTGTSNKAFYHSLIHACAKAGDPHSAGWCAERMVRKGLQPNRVTFNSVIFACAKAGNVDLAQKWWDQMIKCGINPNDITYNTMINACAQARNARKAEAWVHQMEEDGFVPCVVSISSVIDAFAKTGNVEEATKWFRRMEHLGIQPDAVIYNSLIHACAKAGDPLQAEQWMQLMKDSGLRPDEKTFNSVINACAKGGAVERAQRWFQLMEHEGCRVDKVTFGSMIYASAKVGDVDAAEFWMEKMLTRGIEPNFVCFNTVLRACVPLGHAARAVKWFNAMEACGIPPNRGSFHSVVQAHVNGNDVAGAEWWQQKMISAGFHSDLVMNKQAARRNSGNSSFSQDIFEGADCEDVPATILARPTHNKVFAPPARFPAPGHKIGGGVGSSSSAEPWQAHQAPALRGPPVSAILEAATEDAMSRLGDQHALPSSSGPAAGYLPSSAWLSQQWRPPATSTTLSRGPAFASEQQQPARAPMPAPMAGSYTFIPQEALPVNASLAHGIEFPSTGSNVQVFEHYRL